MGGGRLADIERRSPVWFVMALNSETSLDRLQGRKCGVATFWGQVVFAPGSAKAFSVAVGGRTLNHFSASASCRRVQRYGGQVVANPLSGRGS